jgi:hypothetical protein
LKLVSDIGTKWNPRTSSWDNANNQLYRNFSSARQCRPTPREVFLAALSIKLKLYLDSLPRLSLVLDLLVRCKCTVYIGIHAVA